ncbi:MAG: tyrosine-type recombinase/integrase [Candidatus Longimicrobiales bacterium M2_2A_002]
MAKKNPLYKKNGRYYADFRGYSDVGGGQEAMIPDDERYATKDYRVAKKLAKRRQAELRRLRKAGLEGENGDLRKLGPFVDYHLKKEAKKKGATLTNLAQVAQRLSAAIEFFGADTLLRSIDTFWLQQYVEDLREREKWKGTDRETEATIDPATQRKYLNDLSKVFRRARSIKVLPGYHRPFDDLMDLPEIEDEEAEWMDGPTATLLLEAARLYQPKRPDIALPCAYTIIATLLLTGLRPSEGLGLLIEDIDFERKRIRVRRNRFRRLKTKKSRRVIPLWPQLEAILRAYLAARGNPTKGVLFPSPRKPGKPVRTIKRLVEELELRIEYDGDLTPKVFRHSYCAARLQTLDNGAPISTFKVSRELGHKDTSMVEDIYGHVGPGIAGAPRKDYVEFLLGNFEDALGDRVEKMQARTEIRNEPKSVNLKNRVPVETELAVLEFAGREPRRGPKKAAKALNDEGVEVSASGVRWILKRYELHRAEFRLEAIESGRLAEVVEEVTQLRAG